MELQLEQIREQQKETWNKFSPGCFIDILLRTTYQLLFGMNE